MKGDVIASESTSGQGWPGVWMRPFLELCVLRCIADGPTYGYAISARLAEAGITELKGGVLYPLLGRLEREHLVRTRWEAGDGGPGRKFYELTPAGRAQLAGMLASWDRFTTDVTSYLGSRAESRTKPRSSKPAPAPAASPVPSVPVPAAPKPGRSRPSRIRPAHGVRWEQEWQSLLAEQSEPTNARRAEAGEMTRNAIPGLRQLDDASATRRGPKEEK